MNIKDWLDEIADQLPTCCICNEKYVGYGNNAEPYMKGICCNKCNEKIVIPFRIQQIVDSWTFKKDEK